MIRTRGKAARLRQGMRGQRQRNDATIGFTIAATAGQLSGPRVVLEYRPCCHLDSTIHVVLEDFGKLGRAYVDPNHDPHRPVYC